MELLFWISFILLLYVYIGYPFLVFFLSLFIDKKVNKKDIEPKVSMVIAAYNEEKEIAAKIENSLGLEYPKDKLEIIVISDASTDKTDEIVKSYKSRGIKYLRQEEQQGKTAALNRAVPEAGGELLFFTDANAMMKPDALKKLVRNFADESVGYVCGLSLYGNRDDSLVGGNESSYWDYETKIRTAENKLGSIVGSDGAIYMLRKELYTPLRKSDINDFVNPLQVISRNYRGVFESEAICFENAGVEHGEEFRRKVRIVNRSLNGLFRVKKVLNPFKYGFFSVEIISHKLLRWFSPVFMVLMFVTNYLIANKGYFLKLIFLMQFFLYSFALIGYFVSLLTKKREGNMLLNIFHIPFYFIMVNVASVLGILKFITGEVQVTWQPERSNV